MTQLFFKNHRSLEKIHNPHYLIKDNYSISILLSKNNPVSVFFNKKNVLPSLDNWLFHNLLKQYRNNVNIYYLNSVNYYSKYFTPFISNSITDTYTSLDFFKPLQLSQNRTSSGVVESRLKLKRTNILLNSMSILYPQLTIKKNIKPFLVNTTALLNEFNYLKYLLINKQMYNYLNLIQLKKLKPSFLKNRLNILNTKSSTIYQINSTFRKKYLNITGIAITKKYKSLSLYYNSTNTIIVSKPKKYNDKDKRATYKLPFFIKKLLKTNHLKLKDGSFVWSNFFRKKNNITRVTTFLTLLQTKIYIISNKFKYLIFPNEKSLLRRKRQHRLKLSNSTFLNKYSQHLPSKNKNLPLINSVSCFYERFSLPSIKLQSKHARTTTTTTFFKTNHHTSLSYNILLNPYINLFYLDSLFNLKFLFHKLYPQTKSLNYSYSKLLLLGNLNNTNIIPTKNFSYVFTKKVSTSLMLKKLSVNFIPTYLNTIIRFIESLTGHKVILQFYPFVTQSITTN